MYVRRNDPCYCQSGLKYKHCCLEKDRHKIPYQKKPLLKISPDKITLMPSDCIGRGHSPPFFKSAQEIYEQKKQFWSHDKQMEICKKYGLDPNVSNYGDYSQFPLDSYDNLSSLTAHEYRVWLCNFIVKLFKMYLDCSEEKQKFIFAYDFCENKKCIIELTNKFHKKYTRKVNRVMNGAKKRFGNKDAFMLTLNVDPAYYDWDLVKAWRNIRKDFHDFMEACRLHIKREKRKDGLTNLPKYIATIEPFTGKKNGKGENTPAYGFPHIHIVFLNAKRLIDWRKLKQYWKAGSWEIGKDKGGYHVKYPINYITKYITKTFTTPDSSDPLPQALVWFFGLRSYTNSRDTLDPLNGYGSCFEAICFVSLNPTENLADYLEYIHNYVETILQIPITT